MKDFEKILDEALQLIIENEKFEEPKAVKFSKEHEEKMRKIFEEEREKENKKRIKTFVKIASLAACVVLLFFVINSFYVKENSLNKPQPIVGEDTRNNILTEYIPQGFEKVGERITANVVLLSYSKGDEYFRISVNAAASAKSEIENATEKVKVNSFTGMYSSADGVNSLLWSDNDRVYSVTGNISKDEIIKIAEGVKHNEN